MTTTRILVDSRLRIECPAELPVPVEDEIRAEFTHPNPAHEQWLASAPRVRKFKSEPPKTIATWRSGGAALSLPRGGADRLRRILGEHGIRHEFVDRRSLGTQPAWGRGLKHNLTLFAFQGEMVRAALKYQNCILRAPCGGGKTSVGIAVAARVGVSTLVVVPSTRIFDEWMKRLGFELGLAPDEIGWFGRGVKRIRPITVATVDALRRHVAALAPVFGCVIFDECFEGNTPVLMADGSLRPIARVREGEQVALGGTVHAVLRRPYRGPLFKLGSGYMTPEHPIATSGGWISVSKVAGSDFLWYDPDHELREVRQEAPTSQQTGGVQTPHDIFRGWGVREVRPGGACEAEGGARGSCLSDPVERRQRIGRSQDCPCCCDASGDQEARGISSDVESLAESGMENSTGCTHERRSAQAVFPARGGRGESQAGAWDGEGREDNTFWGAPSWEGEAADRLRDGTQATIGTSRICGGTDHRNGQPGAELLCDRLGARGSEVGSGDRWEQPFDRGAMEIRRAQDLLPHVSRLAGAALPGACRLQSGSANVHRVDLDLEIDVWNLETEIGVYIAGGVLVHNCHRAPAATVYPAIDALPCKYRIGISADERRKDRKHGINYDLFGRVVVDVPQEMLVEQGVVHAVAVRLVPTDFEADWYVKLKDQDKRRPDLYKRLLDEMVADDARTALAVEYAVEACGAHPTLVFSHRVEHCVRMRADVLEEVGAVGIRVGVVLGEKVYQAESDATVAGLQAGTYRCGVGTYQSIGTGVDLPAVESGVAVTPILANRQNFVQVRDRLCRVDRRPGATKRGGTLYVLWDRKVFGDRPLRNAVAWCPGRVEVFDEGVSPRYTGEMSAGPWVDGREYLRRGDEYSLVPNQAAPADRREDGL